MLNLNDMVVTAKLKNNKQVVLEPIYSESKLKYRYMVAQEIKDDKLDLISNRFWLETQIFKTLDEEGTLILFAEIEGSAIVLMRL